MRLVARWKPPSPSTQTVADGRREPPAIASRTYRDRHALPFLERGHRARYRSVWTYSQNGSLLPSEQFPAVSAGRVRLNWRLVCRELLARGGGLFLRSYTWDKQRAHTGPAEWVR